MKGVGRALRAEWLRLRARWAVLALPLAALLGAAYAWALGAAVDSGVMGAPSGFYLAASAASGAALTCAVVGALAAASGVGGDVASGLVRTVLTRPIDRGAWVAGRVLALGGGMACVFLCACVGALAAGLVRFGAAGSAEGGYVIAGAGFLARQLLGAVALSLLAQLAAVALGGAVGALVGRAGGAVVVAVVAGAGLVALGRSTRVDPLLPLGPVTAALDRVAQLAQGLAAHHVGDGAWAAIGVCVVWIGAALALGGVALARGDIVT
jgi:ABC-type transport system involved in multi-copper enzyme maturation permease subunit